MTKLQLYLMALLLCALTSLPVMGQDGKPPVSITTPDTVESRIGTLKFEDGAPSKETAEKVYDNLDFTYAFRAFTDTFKGVSVQAALEGFRAAGIKAGALGLSHDVPVVAGAIDTTAAAVGSGAVEDHEPHL